MHTTPSDVDTTVPQASYQNVSWPNACKGIGKTVPRYGFTRRQESVYFADDTVDAVRCVLAVHGLSRNDVRSLPAVYGTGMLRIEDNNDLMPALAAVRP